MFIFDISENVGTSKNLYKEFLRLYNKSIALFRKNQTFIYKCYILYIMARKIPEISDIGRARRCASRGKGLPHGGPWRVPPGAGPDYERVLGDRPGQAADLSAPFGQVAHAEHGFCWRRPNGLIFLGKFSVFFLRKIQFWVFWLEKKTNFEFI